MPIASSLEHIQKLVGATALSPSKNIVFEGLEFDSREIKGGELFVALPGEKSHGNNFVGAALDRGASLVLADRAAALPDIHEKERVLLVDNTLTAFWEIAGWWRDQIKLPTFAVTGSVGKTTVKEMTAAILLQKGAGTYSAKSHNNQVGVPYTICRASRNQRWLVLEIGMNHRGEIAPLSQLARPQVVAITNIAPAHIGFLGSMEAIADEKLDIIKGLEEAGVVLLNAQSNVLCKKFKELNIDGRIANHFFGTDISGTGALSEVKSLALQGISFKLELDGEPRLIKMNVLGRQNAWNAACAALAAKFVCPELSTQEIVSGLSRFTAPLMRLNVRYLANASVVIDDSYNANPASMSCAIELLADLRRPGQKIGLVIGDMLELGDFCEQYHKEIGTLVGKIKPDFVIAVGAAADGYLIGVNTQEMRYKHCTSSSQAAELLKNFDFDFLLVKASRGIGLDRVVSDLVHRIGELPFEPQLAAESEAEEGKKNSK